MIEITEETTIDLLAKENGRSDLEELAKHLEIEEPATFKNKTQLAQAILAKYDEPEDDAPEGEDEEMPSDPTLSDVRNWKVHTTIQYTNQRGKRCLAFPGDVIKNIPNNIAQDLCRRGRGEDDPAVLEPVLR
ncbi:MAG: hypothetical protein V3W41_21995 [Planctomycetota bacterium]